VQILKYSEVIFTIKEFDEDGKVEGSGIEGIKLFYFGWRNYDPEIGMWTSTDPAHQFFNSYRYTSNPINFIDLFGLTEVYIIENTGLAITPDVKTIDDNLKTLAKNYENAGYSVSLNLTSSLQNFKDAFNDNEAVIIYFVGHGNSDNGYSVLVTTTPGENFSPMLINSDEYENSFKAINTNVIFKVASCNQQIKDYKNLPNTELYPGKKDGIVDLIKASKTYANDKIVPKKK